MSVDPNVAIRKRKKQEPKPQSQLNKCLNEKRRREQENIYIEELAELISASTSDMSSLSVKPDKCAILQETVNQIRRIKQEPGQSDELQQSEVSSSKPTILANDIYGPLLLEALDGFLFVVNVDGKIEFVSENVTSFLKYAQDDIVDKNIYDIIHPSDHTRFNSNLLPMMSLGNGCNWTTEPTSGLSKSRSFNCRFLIKPTEESESNNMEDKQSSSHMMQYENMQVSAVFFPFARDVVENNGNESDNQNRLACVARRIPANEKSPTSLGVEQFTTRLDVTGKITTIDTSGVSALYSQYLNKELTDCNFQDLCHPSDVPKIVQHLKDTLQSSSNTTVMYKLRVGPDRYVTVQTKSKLFHFNQSTSEQEFIMSTHSIIRDSDNTTVPAPSEGSPKSISQPSLMSASSSVASTSSPSAAVTVSSLTMPSYPGVTTLSPSNAELVLGDLLLDIFPNASWNIDQNAVQQEGDGSSPAPNVVCTMATAISSATSSRLSSGQTTSSAFSPEVATVRSASANSSPATPGRVPTPYRCSGAFSPSSVQGVSGKVSPLSGQSSSVKTEKIASGASEGLVAEIPTSGAKHDGLANIQANQKLRNLLMQNNEDNSTSHSNHKRNSRDEDVVVIGRSGNVNVFENRSQVPRPVAAVVGIPQAQIAPGNVILRELLNQDEEDTASDSRNSSSDRNASARLSGLQLNVNMRKADTDRQKLINDNNMLRRLLNNNDDTDNSNKRDDIIQQLLKSDVAERSNASQRITRTLGEGQSSMMIDDSPMKSVTVDSSLDSPGTFSITESIVMKRKSSDESEFTGKKQNVGSHHAHLAGQNPMLASMLARTPRTPLTIPISIANTIMTQLPQDRLPKNLEKKLIHTPYTTASNTPSTTTTTQTFGTQMSGRMLLSSSTPLQQDVVTSDSRGHLLQNSSANIQAHLAKASYQTSQQGFLNKILSGSTESGLTRSLSVPSTVHQVVPNNFGVQFQQTVAETSTPSRGLRDMLNDSMAVDANLATATAAQSSQSSDPFYAELLDQIYSLQEEMNVQPTIDETSDILKILDDVIDTTNSFPSTSVSAAPAASTAQDIDEKIAISAIQKQLMSFEGAPPASPVNSLTLQNPIIQTFAQSGGLNNPMTTRKVTQVPVTLTPASAFAALQLGVNGTQPPTYTNSLVASRVRLPVTTPTGAIVGNSQQLLGLAAMQRMGLQQHAALGTNVNQIRRSLIERRQKIYLHQQQKRLLEQQQKQQMTMQTQQPLDIIGSQGSNAFPDNINELLNNTVAPPNVTLQRSSNVAEPQLSPRYNTNLIGPIPSPGVAQPSTPSSQLSPGQRASAQSPFSPLSQQPFPSPTPPPPVPVLYQQSRLSPHSLSTYGQQQQQQQSASSHSSPSPAPQSGPHSPHLQLSPQQSSSTTQWSQRVTQSSATNNLLQQNPMLNAQLSQTSFTGNQTKFTAQQRQQLAMRTLPSPSSIQTSRNSPFQGQGDGSFSPLSPVAVYQNQSQQQQQQQQQQQMIHQSPQQQFVLSEFTQNLTLRANSHYSEGADALALMQATGGLKFATDSTQTHAIPIFDPVTVGQALLHQQLQQQQQQLQHQHITQSLQEAKRQQHQTCDKNSKSLKGKAVKSQQQVLQNSPPQVQSLQAQSTQQAIKHQLTTTCGDACALVGNIPVDATGVLTLSGMGTPAFPVSLSVSPGNLSSPISVGTNCAGAALAHNLALEEGLMIASPARTLHDTLGDIITSPTTQLAGNQLNLGQCPANLCGEPCAAAARSRSLSLTSLAGGAVNGIPLTFHSLAPSMGSCVPLQVASQAEGLVPSHHVPHLGHNVTAAPSTPAPPLYPPLDLNSQTDSNHDTALTLACAGGHEELVSLLLSRGADIEHRDKKGFTPLMLAATAGHAGVVEILLNHAADIEAQSERTKDTALSLACSGGRYEVVDILLARGANKEHRNVSDYTPLSLAASGGYVNIIKLLLSHGAEINSRTGSKLGISPLMLAAMNGHTQAVKLLLDMGSDINAQIETNRNTALTLACFQGRHEVVNLLLERKANVEHRAKTGLTPLMEAASGGYVEVGKVLIDQGADVNAPPVPSSRDTALTIAADKGHYRFVDLLLQRDAIVDVKNKKGNSPLWLAANGGHLDVVQLLVANSADIDSQDNRKVSCLMAAFRKGHIKTVKWMVKHVTQFPSEQDVERFISTITDKDFLKKANTCAEAIRQAKERQAAEANKNANILLEELDLERSREEIRKAAAARRRERKRRKKREKQEQLRAAKAAAEESKKSDTGCDQDSTSKQQQQVQNSQSDAEDEYEDDEEEDEEEEEEEKAKNIERIPDNELSAASGLRLSGEYFRSQNSSSASNSTVYSESSKGRDGEGSTSENVNVPKNAIASGRSLKKREREREKMKMQQKSKKAFLSKTSIHESRNQKEMPVAGKQKLVESACVSTSGNRNKKRNQKMDVAIIATSTSSPTTTTTTNSVAKSAPTMVTSTQSHTLTETKCHSHIQKYAKSSKEVLVNGISSNVDYSDFCNIFASATTNRCKANKCPIDGTKLSLDTDGELALDLSNEVNLSVGLKSPSASSISHCLKSPLANSTSPKKWQKRDEGWKEVVRRSKKVSVPSTAISRVIGRGGCNINAIREGSGAHIEVEKQKGQGERTIIIRGSAESTRLAQHLITALIKEPEKELSEILIRYGITRLGGPNSVSSSENNKQASSTNNSTAVTTTQAIISTAQGKGSTRLPISTKSSAVVTSSKSTSIPPPSLPANSQPPFSNQVRSGIMQSIRPGIPVCTVATPPFLNSSHGAWTGVVVSGKVPANIVPRPTVPMSNPSSTLNLTTVTTRVVATTTVEKSPVVRQLFPLEKSTSQQGCSTTATKTTVSYTMAVISQGKAPKTVPANVVTVATKVTTTSDTKVSTIAPNVMERAGSAPPSSAVINSHISLGHNSGLSSVQPFSVNTSSRPSNGVAISQQPPAMSHMSRVHRCQTPTQSKPFVSSAPASNQASPTNNPPSTSVTSSVSQSSSLSQVYTPFCNNNLFCQVAQPFVYGQKDKESSKPNFASVAASGVTSVSCQVQNSNPVQSSLTLSLPQNNDELIVDAAKAPGYRGNLHISPSASSNSSSSSIPSQPGVCGSSNFGPIGSGPRSAPCTPPLGPIGPLSSSGANTRRSTPPVPSSPPPSLHSRSLPDSHSAPLNDLPHTISSSCSEVTQQHVSSQMTEAMFHHQSMNMSSHGSRLQSYPLASSFSGPAGTSTTFSQHSPLSSVGTIVPEGTNNGNLQVVQSNLNPNAPDFSSRASLLMAQHGPPMHMPQRLPSGPNSFQENTIPPHIAAQFRPILPSACGITPTFPLHAMPNHHPQAMNRFPLHHGPNHQQVSEYSHSAPSGPIGSFPPGMGNLSQNAEHLPLLGMMGGYPPHPQQVVHGSSNVAHYPVMHSMMGIRPNQRSSATPSIGTSSKGDGSPIGSMSPNVSPQNSDLPSPTDMNVQENPAGTIGEDRKLPRPIGMERAQRKNPMFGAEIAASEWIQNMQGLTSGQPLPQEDAGLPPLLHNSYTMGNRFSDMLTSETNHPVDQHSYQAVAGAAVSGGGGCFPFVNGLPAHLLAAHMYATPNNTATSHLEQQIEMWNMQHKIPLSSGEGLPQNVEHKMTWQNWGPHQA